MRRSSNGWGRKRSRYWIFAPVPTLKTRLTIKKEANASLIFFTGGDQLRITSQIGDSPTFQMMQERYHAGTTIVGTSAGAAAMPETMLISGNGEESFRISALGMSPELGFIGGVVIDSHFAERGRIGRLLGAVTQNPKNLGLGEGAVYIVDGTTITYSSLAEDQAEGIVSIFDVKLHVLAKHDCFDLVKKQPVAFEQVENKVT